MKPYLQNRDSSRNPITDMHLNCVSIGDRQQILRRDTVEYW